MQNIYANQLENNYGRVCWCIKAIRQTNVKTATLSVVANMVKSRELSQKLRKEEIFRHSQGDGYKTIAKRLNISRDTVGSIIRKYKAKGTVATLPGRGQRKKLSSTARRLLRRQIEKNPRVTAKELQKDLAASSHSKTHITCWRILCSNPKTYTASDSQTQESSALLCPREPK